MLPTEDNMQLCCLYTVESIELCYYLPVQKIAMKFVATEDNIKNNMLLSTDDSVGLCSRVDGQL